MGWDLGSANSHNMATTVRNETYPYHVALFYDKVSALLAL
jgi:hypothetical protein